MRSRRIGLVGCGTIGAELALAVDKGTVRNASIVSLLDIERTNSERLASSLSRKPAVHGSLDEFFSDEFDLLIEAASQQAVKSFALRTLELGRDLMTMSAGALADDAFLEELKEASEKSGARIYVPSGAIAGLDAIRAARSLITTASLSTTKNPKALAGAPFFQSSNIVPESIRTRTVLFEGSASEAVRLFPANVNVAAVLSLAGIGSKQTYVKIIADPASTKNLHEIAVSGSFGEIRVSVNNMPSPSNPKTSYLAVLSAIECLRSICEGGVRIGS